MFWLPGYINLHGQGLLSLEGLASMFSGSLHPPVHALHVWSKPGYVIGSLKEFSSKMVWIEMKFFKLPYFLVAEYGGDKCYTRESFWNSM